MMEYLMLVGGLISGALIYYALKDSIEEHMNIHLTKNIIFPIFVILVLLIGVYITNTIQLNERAAANSNGTQKVSIYPCFFEDSAACNALTNKMNNDNYASYTAGKSAALNLYIGFSLIDVLRANVFTYFCFGILFVWGSLFLYSLKKVEA